MSRIGKKPVILPAGVELSLADGVITVKGPKGELKQEIAPAVKIEIQEADSGKVATVTVENEELDKAIWGTARAIVANMVRGVTEGWSKILELNGVGFKIDLKGTKLVMRLGFSHEVEYQLPEGIEAKVEGNVLTISGIDKQKVGQVASEIRSLKKPEPYKGKGFKYQDEVIRRKAGKAAKGE
ncbi:50S ribosomal protein L6 [Candidatus Parcubacteria bacterium]|nr:MAG: 50S ribosomal protein L6 [Candidatus Parcubacteria bacterium]